MNVHVKHVKYTQGNLRSYWLPAPFFFLSSFRYYFLWIYSSIKHQARVSLNLGLRLHCEDLSDYSHPIDCKTTPRKGVIKDLSRTKSDTEVWGNRSIIGSQVLPRDTWSTTQFCNAVLTLGNIKYHKGIRFLKQLRGIKRLAVFPCVPNDNSIQVSEHLGLICFR